MSEKAVCYLQRPFSLAGFVVRYLLFPVPCLYPALAAIVLALAVPLTAKAQSATISLPSAADVGRVTAPTYETPEFRPDSGLLPATPPPALVPAPEAAKKRNTYPEKRYGRGVHYL